MKTIFVVNPAAGKGQNTDILMTSITDEAKRMNADVDIYVTESVGDATEYVRNLCSDNSSLRFIACGGDGTLNEVLNGAYGFENVQVGVYPIGTGNDFCRNFSADGDFSNIKYQILGECVLCDAIRYKTTYNNTKKSGYCINMFNIGFDANVAFRTTEIKTKPFLSGSFAYFVSIMENLVKKKCTELEIFLDGKSVCKGKFLLTSIANGSYCGGGIKSNPLADPQNGMININIVKNVSRSRFLSLLPRYMKGTIFENSTVGKYISSHYCKSARVVPADGYIKLCVDGEIIDAEAIEFEIVPDAFNFVLPASDSVAVMHG